MYDATPDPYCYPGTTVLKNLRDIRTQATLDTFEAAITAQRADEPLPVGRLSVRHYRNIHRHLFQDVYAWAGAFRTVRTGKGGNPFCYPENIAHQMDHLFADLRGNNYLRELSLNAFAKEATHFLATLNAIHPFREGNGRTQTTFLVLLANYAGHPIDLDKLDPHQFLRAMIESFGGKETRLNAEIRRFIS